jgi:hypothetical protein
MFSAKLSKLVAARDAQALVRLAASKGDSEKGHRAGAACASLGAEAIPEIVECLMNPDAAIVNT